MNENAPMKETSPDVIFALLLFLICILISLFFDTDSIVNTIVFSR